MRVQLTPTRSSTSRDPGTSTPAAIRKAALDGSPGTTTCSSSSSSTLPIVDVTSPLAERSRLTAAPALSSIRSVWSRVATGSITEVRSVASPASRTHDLT